ncbi:MAG: 30S ribosomal protein S18 [Candidatus Eisenbacteria bacterium]|nr:30S ribosomal protein S18 [Candidatus Eisenbacteria bacterium]
MARRERHGKICRFCQDKIEKIDYKDEKRLLRFVSEQGKMIPRRVTGTCARHQRQLAVAIKRARHIALMPHYGGHYRRG